MKDILVQNNYAFPRKLDIDPEKQKLLEEIRKKDEEIKFLKQYQDQSSDTLLEILVNFIAEQIICFAQWLSKKMKKEK